MGLFHKQKSREELSDEEAAALEGHFLDENFREELRNHGRLYFEKVINENARLFKEDLDATIVQVNNELKDHVIGRLDASISRVNIELKEHITKQLDDQFSEYGRILKESQDEALKTLNASAQAVEQEHQQLSTTLQKSVANQRVMVTNLFDQNMSEMKTVKESQDEALKTLNESVGALKQQYEQLSTTLKESVEKQEDMMIGAFEQNMARVIEHYLLGALGDQYDMKAQLPSIIGQMESNKQAIVDDMKL
jgi:ribosome-binding ATPase YchF (GTP1/OBG family)